MAVAAARRVRSGPGATQWAALGGAILVLLALTFALGLLMGRQWARHAPPTTAAEPARKAPASPRRSGLTDTAVERAPERQEKLTFYQTLTAPLSAAPVSTPRPEPVARPAPAAPRAAERADPAPPRAEARAAAASPEWTVQVGVFKSAPQAEAVKARLGRGGFDGQITASPGDDGQPRYRVRVGSFKTRDDASRAAERIRADRSLSTFVTAK